MFRLFKYGLKKLLINRLYNLHVKSSNVIQEDVTQTLKVRGSNVQSESIDKQFKHLMMYYPEYAFIFFWRIKKQPWYYSWFTKDYNCKVFKSSKIGGGLMCFHPFSTVINAKKIGRNFQFRNGLTIGNKNNNNNLLPIIGDDVTVGPNTVIIGDIQIGDNVVIGAGSVVVKDVPSNVIIAGNPAKILKHF